MTEYGFCGSCKGKGYFVDMLCPWCDGTGLEVPRLLHGFAPPPYLRPAPKPLSRAWWRWFFKLLFGV